MAARKVNMIEAVNFLAEGMSIADLASLYDSDPSAVRAARMKMVRKVQDMAKTKTPEVIESLLGLSHEATIMLINYVPRNGGEAHHKKAVKETVVESKPQLCNNHSLSSYCKRPVESISAPKNEEPKGWRLANPFLNKITQIKFDTDNLLEIIGEDGYYIADFSDITNPSIVPLSSITLAAFKQYSKNDAAVLFKFEKK